MPGQRGVADQQPRRAGGESDSQERPVFFSTESSSGGTGPTSDGKGTESVQAHVGAWAGAGERVRVPEDVKPRPSVWTSFLALFFVQMKIQREPLCCRRPWGGLSQGASGPWTVTLLLFCVLFTCTELSLGERGFFFFFFKLTLK